MKIRITTFLFVCVFLTTNAQYDEPPVKAPFEKIDTYCINDWWNHAKLVKNDPKKIIDVDVPRDQVICFGIYTTQNKVMKMTAQLFPLYPNETREVRLGLKKNEKWEEVAKEKVNDIGWSALFRMEKWDETKDVAYRLRHGQRAVFEGIIRKQPVNKDEIVVASLNCNSNKDREQDGVSMKAVLSQTGFCGGAHRHGTFENDLHADLDCNGWPQAGRKEALRAIKAAGAVHLAGDQHIPTLVQHGIDEYGDGSFAFVAPAIVNTIYKRWWYPLDENPGKNRDPKNPLPFTGDYLDGLGNKITMHAYANVESADKLCDGFGIVRFNKKQKSVTFENWDRFTNVTKKGAQQRPGWPRTIRQSGSGQNIIWKL